MAIRFLIAGGILLEGDLYLVSFFIDQIEIIKIFNKIKGFLVFKNQILDDFQTSLICLKSLETGYGIIDSYKLGKNLNFLSCIGENY